MNFIDEGFTTVANYQEEFYKSDSDCQKAGQPLAKLPYYETYSVKWHEHGLYMPKESLEISKHQIKYHKKPFCDVALLPFNMGNLDHLEVTRTRLLLSNTQYYLVIGSQSKRQLYHAT